MLARRALSAVTCWFLLIAMLWGSRGALGTHAPAVAFTPPPGAAKISLAAWQATEVNATTELLVLLKPQASLPASSQATPVTVHRALWTTARRTQASLRAWLEARHIPYRAYYIVNMLWVVGDRDLLLALAARPDVARITTNIRVRGHLARSLPFAPQSVSWGVSQIGAPQVWAMGYTGEGVVVAGQDTGYDWDHPALIQHYRGYNGLTASHDYNWHDAIHSGGGICGADSPEPCDDYGHGTHTMGTIVGDDGGTHQIGVAPGARWIGCRNMDQGWGTPASYAECFEFFLAPYPVNGTPDDGDPTKAPHVINNSWGCPPEEGCDATHIEILRQVVHNVRAAGIMVVASAGNSGPNCGTVSDPPALYDETYTVGSTDSSDTIATSSSRGPVTVDGSNLRKPDIAAPGVSIYSSVPGGGYGTMSGTSMAGPHVVGAVALLWSARPNLRGNITATEHLLNLTALPRYSTQCGDAPNTVPNNVYGWGRLDALAAVQRALQGWIAGTVWSEDGLRLDGATVTAAQDGETIAATTTDAEGRYRLTLAQGSYALTVTRTGYQSVTRTIWVSGGQTATVDFILTSAVRYGVALTPTTMTLSAEVGITLTRALTLANTGNTTDTFTLAVASHPWPAALTPTVVTLPADATAPLTLTLTVPANALDGARSTALITATSHGDPRHTASTTVTLVAIAACYPIAGLVITWTPALPMEGWPTVLTATVRQGTPPLTYTWNFGRGVAVTGNPITHTFYLTATLYPPSTSTLSQTLLVPYRVSVTVRNACSIITGERWLYIRRAARLYLPIILRAFAVP